MSSRTININESLYEYILDNSLREPEILKRLRKETAGMPNGMMQISPEQGQFMGLLVRLMGAIRILEIQNYIVCFFDTHIKFSRPQCPPNRSNAKKSRRLSTSL